MTEHILKMTNREKSKATILVVEKETNERNHVKTSLKNIGFDNICDAIDDYQALEKLSQRHFTHIIFNANEVSTTVEEFITKLINMEKDIIAIACLSDTDIDYIFKLMIHGARGFIVKPFSFEGIESAITMASKGEPINSLVLQAKDRNEALIAMIMSSVDNLSNILKQSRQFETAKKEIPKYLSNLKNSVNLAHTFAKDGDDGLIVALKSFCNNKLQNAMGGNRHKSRILK